MSCMCVALVCPVTFAVPAPLVHVVSARSDGPPVVVPLAGVRSSTVECRIRYSLTRLSLRVYDRDGIKL